MKKAMIGVLTILILTTAYFAYQTLTLQRQIDNKVDQLITENNLTDTEESFFSNMVVRTEEDAQSQADTNPTVERTEQEKAVSEEETSPVLDTTSIDYGTALSRIENLDQLINLFRYDLGEGDYAAYGYRAHVFYKEVGAETFIKTLAAREDITLQEEITKMIIGELKVLKDVDKNLDLQIYIDQVVHFINDKELTANELRLAYDLRWQLEDLKSGKIE